MGTVKMSINLGHFWTKVLGVEITTITKQKDGLGASEKDIFDKTLKA